MTNIVHTLVSCYGHLDVEHVFQVTWVALDQFLDVCPQPTTRPPAVTERVHSEYFPLLMLYYLALCDTEER